MFDFSDDDALLICTEKFVLASYLCSAEGLEGIPIAAKIIKRNWNVISPHSLLMAMLSFCYYGCLDVDLVHQVFSEDFLKEVDNLIKSFPAGSLKSMEIRHDIMSLNRAVFIDMPDANFPWFHQKFCDELISMSNIGETYLHKEVGQVLGDILEGQSFVTRNVFSPYYYSIDFLLQFDNHGNPMKENKNNASCGDAATKVAVLLQRPKHFTTGIRRLKGGQKLKKRHLEKLGYRVISVDPLVWNGMEMSEKYKYLESGIFNYSEFQKFAKPQ